MSRPSSTVPNLVMLITIVALVGAVVVLVLRISDGTLSVTPETTPPITFTLGSTSTTLPGEGPREFSTESVEVVIGSGITIDPTGSEQGFTETVVDAIEPDAYETLTIDQSVGDTVPAGPGPESTPISPPVPDAATVVDAVSFTALADATCSYASELVIDLLGDYTAGRLTDAGAVKLQAAMVIAYADCSPEAYGTLHAEYINPAFKGAAPYIP